VQPAENPAARADLSRTTSLHKPVSGGAGCAAPDVPPWRPHLRALHSAHPTATAYSLMNLLMGEHNIRVTLPAMKAALEHLTESD
jgi:hypothetical protein